MYNGGLAAKEGASALLVADYQVDTTNSNVAFTNKEMFDVGAISENKKETPLFI